MFLKMLNISSTIEVYFSCNSPSPGLVGPGWWESLSYSDSGIQAFLQLNHPLGQAEGESVEEYTW